VTDDQTLLAAVREMWAAADPAPTDLADRVLFAIRLDDLEYELMRLQESFSAAGARGHETASTMTFAARSLSVMVTVSEAGPAQRRIDGWIAPGAALRVELRTSRGVQETQADADGRFAFAALPTGLTQLMIHPTAGATVSLNRSVATPPVQL
jgi:hypothetical protein